MLTILIALKQTKQIETYLFFLNLHDSGDRQFPRIKKGDIYITEIFQQVWSTWCQDYELVSIKIHDLGNC